MGKRKKEELHRRTSRAPRADARRNEEAILQAARELFGSTGVDVTVREIARTAGVGIGTVYRRFPKRADLVAAVFRHEMDLCVAEAETLSAQYAPGEALCRWLQRYGEFMATKKGLSVVLHSGDPAFDTLPGYFSERFEPALGALLDKAAAAEEVRDDIMPNDLLRAIGNLTHTRGDDGTEHTRRMVSLLFDGLRHRPTAEADPS